LTPREAARAADLAAAEAVTEADSAQPAAPEPALTTPKTQDGAAPPKQAEPRKKKKPKWTQSEYAEKRAASDELRAREVEASLLRVKEKSRKPGWWAPHLRKPKARTPEVEATEAATPRTVIPPKPKEPKPMRAPTPKLELPPVKYHVSRSSEKNYPVYTDFKRGGNLHITTIRKITGDLSALRDELRVFLNKKDGEVRINDLTQQVIIKGHHVDQVTKFLQARGM
jgi:large subunit ribosomal protein L49